MLRSGLAAAAAIALALLPSSAVAAEAVGHVSGDALGVFWAIPFIGILLSIALLPLLAPHFWHHHFGKVSAFWALAFLIPFALGFGWEAALFEIVSVGLSEYLPFIILLAALFTVAGGIRLKGRLLGTPVVNSGILLAGTVLASWMGTTGAAMLLIRPLCRAIRFRRYRIHTVVFFIFLVANVGGALTPLGDPPLFLGFLQGVDFFWPTVHLFPQMLMLSLALLAIYFIVDTVLYRREDVALPEEVDVVERFGFAGAWNFLLLAGIVGAVLLSGVWRPEIQLEIFHVTVELQNIVRDVVLIGLLLLSVRITDAEERRRNGFTWFPIVEVAKLFAAIFITIAPVIAMLRAGETGPMGPIIGAVTDRTGTPIDEAYFWLTGALSSFLDNAPTYLVFFNTAGGDAQVLMGPLASTLTAISAGAVFFGAMTYIGNAPNFMVRSIAHEAGLAMPSFFGYMLWSGVILLPLFGLMTWLYYL